MVTIPSNIDANIAINDTENISFNPLPSFNANVFVICTNINEASSPDNMPRGIPTTPSIAASNNTFFLICF
ncbi:unknown [Clostridium sp. CAG:1219]|nr:unknown [Clostridium sp. CAG:1219]